VSAPLLTMTDVRGGYGEADILDGVSLHVDAGEIVVIVGPNGAGKSSAMKAVFGLLRVRGGRIVFDGEDITGWSPERIVRRGICFVPQVDNVFRDMSVHENLEMGAFLRRGDLSAAFDRVYALFPDLKARARTLAGNLSGGQRQTVAIARSVLKKAKLVILDEPTAALGVAQTEQVLNLVRRLADQGVAVIIISHNLQDVFKVADYISVLYLGTMVASIPKDQTTSDDVVGYITGSKTYDGANA